MIFLVIFLIIAIVVLSVLTLTINHNLEFTIKQLTSLKEEVSRNKVEMRNAKALHQKRWEILCKYLNIKHTFIPETEKLVRINKNGNKEIQP